LKSLSGDKFVKVTDLRFSQWLNAEANSVPVWLNSVDLGRIADISGGTRYLHLQGQSVCVYYEKVIGSRGNQCPVWHIGNRKAASRTPPTVNLYNYIMSDEIQQMGIGQMVGAYILYIVYFKIWQLGISIFGDFT
jgi:hypothetical protein